MSKSERLDATPDQVRLYFINLAKMGKEKAREILDNEKKLTIEVIEKDPELAKQLAVILKNEDVVSEKPIGIPPYYEGKIISFLARISTPKRLDATKDQTKSYFLNLAEFGKEKAREILEKEKKTTKLNH